MGKNLRNRGYTDKDRALWARQQQEITNALASGHLVTAIDGLGRMHNVCAPEAPCYAVDDTGKSFAVYTISIVGE